MSQDLTDPIYQRTPVPFIVIPWSTHLTASVLPCDISSLQFSQRIPVAFTVKDVYLYMRICGDRYLCICQYIDHGLLIPVLSGFM